jgi:dienelactone hydrolase
MIESGGLLRSPRGSIVLLALTLLGMASLLLAGGALHVHPSAAPMPPDAMTDFGSFPFRTEGHTYTVYTRGEGPSVLLLHELPGLTPQCVRLARLLSDAHFKVFVPLLFGKPGVSAPRANAWRSCFFAGYSCFSSTHPGSIARRMRALSASLHAEHPEARMGVLGMCLSGALPIYLMRDEWVAAPIVSQPALPLAFAAKASLGLSPQDLALAKGRGIPLLYLRFSEDAISPKERLQALKEILGSELKPYVICSAPGNSFGINTKAHAVLTSELNLEVPNHPTKLALEEVISFLNERLR